MSNIKLIHSDIFDVPSEVIVHQANCFNTMGSGIAAQIKKKYPEAYEADCRTTSGDVTKLGSISVARSRSDNRVIINLYGQYLYGTDSRKTNYEAVYSGLCLVRKYMETHNLKTLSVPFKMGCALGGGNWDIVQCMIEVVFEESDISVNICKKV